MATTTTNYGFDIPQSTDLVKDGATAIATLGQDIDTAMNTALGTKKAGMVLLNTTSFSAVASQSINDVFSATYKNYKIFANINHSTGNTGLALRLRVGGSDNSTASSYTTIQVRGTGSSAIVTTPAAANIASVGAISNTLINGIEGAFYSPFEATATGFQFNSLNTDGPQIYLNSGNHNQTVSYDGFTLSVASGTITGTVRIYGLAD